MDPVVAELDRGVLRAVDLRVRLGVSPATLMRTVRRAGPDLIRIGRGRATQYALRRPWLGFDGSRFPLFRVSETGTARTAGELVTLAAAQTVWMPDGLVSQGLPIEIADACPSGFLGRHFAATHPNLRLPARVPDWSEHHVLMALSRRGEDLPGHLIVGEESFARWQAEPGLAQTRDDYPAIAAATTAGHPPGSSAGGERPKFGVFVEGRHVLVKFAARGGAGDRGARRWCDLLVLEALALSVVSARNIAAAPAHVIETPSHWFLESERFDRVGLRGRVAVSTMAAVHQEPADSWARAARLLGDAGRIAEQDAWRLRWLDAFGALIGNTDRHHHNIVFFTEERRLRLAPAFDQVPMAYAPSADGQVSSPVLMSPHATADTLEVWDDARAAARQFWELAADDRRLSDDIGGACAANAKALLD